MIQEGIEPSSEASLIHSMNVFEKAPALSIKLQDRFMSLPYHTAFN